MHDVNDRVSTRSVPGAPGNILEVSMLSERLCRPMRLASVLGVIVAIGLAGCGNTQSGAVGKQQDQAKATPTDLSRGQSPSPGSSPAQSTPHDPARHPWEQAPPAVTKDSLADAIASYVQNEAAHSGGYFRVQDPQQKTSLALTLTEVHRDRLSQLKDGRYFACADFKGRDGHVYDIDVFMQDNGNGLNATDVTVHKEDGHARYDWVEENGTWTRKPTPKR